MFNVIGLINSIEFQLEVYSLVELGLSNEEIEGFFEVYWDSWVVPTGVTYDKN